jgi:hypothetical protein
LCWNKRLSAEYWFRRRFVKENGARGAWMVIEAWLSELGHRNLAVGTWLSKYHDRNQDDQNQNDDGE